MLSLNPVNELVPSRDKEPQNRPKTRYDNSNDGNGNSNHGLYREKYSKLCGYEVGWLNTSGHSTWRINLR